MKNKLDKTTIEKVAIWMTEWVGSVQSLIIHTILFVSCFVMVLLGVNFDEVLLLLTTVVSLEAIYLAIFIQMSVNRTAQSLEEVEEDIDEIQEDVDEIQKDVDEIQEDVDEIQQDDDTDDGAHKASLDSIKEVLQNLIKEVESLKK